ncbi:MAG: hypothetical protein HY875_05200 [Chloroflexi bacterium]|nr:hypothetical protein [Chloroflexota bacterium]
MKVLMIGASDTLGTYLPDPSQGTFSILARELPPLLHDSVEVAHMRFYSHFPKAPEHAESSVRDRAPDVTIIAAHSMAFATPSVGARLVHIFGWKAGRWLERRIWDADARARKGGILAPLRDPARAVAYRVIGVSTFASVEETIRHYGETMKRLARFEDMQVIVLGTFQPRRDGDIAPHVQLNTGLAALAREHRLKWIDRQAIVTSLGDDAFQPGGRYSTALVHRKVADAVIDAVRS